MNINIYNPYVRAELYHHGILGQKWGKRNGPPYPLGAGDHSASEKKAGWRKSLAENRYLRKQTKKLNKQDVREVKATHKLRNTEEKIKAEVRNSIGDIVQGKGLTDKRIAKLNALDDERRLNRMDLEKARNVTKNLLLQMSNEGYHISHEKTIRSANKGKDIAATVLALSGLAGVGIGYVGTVLGNRKMMVAGTAAGLAASLSGSALLDPNNRYTGRKYKVTKDDKNAYSNQTVFKVELDKDTQAKLKAKGKRNPQAELEKGADAYIKNTMKEKAPVDEAINRAKQTPDSNRTPFQKAILTPKGKQLYTERVKNEYKNNYYSEVGSKYDVGNDDFDKMIDKSYNDFTDSRSEFENYVKRFR